MNVEYINEKIVADFIKTRTEAATVHVGILSSDVHGLNVVAYFAHPDEASAIVAFEKITQTIRVEKAAEAVRNVILEILSVKNNSQKFNISVIGRAPRVFDTMDQIKDILNSERHIYPDLKGKHLVPLRDTALEHEAFSIMGIYLDKIMEDAESGDPVDSFSEEPEKEIIHHWSDETTAPKKEEIMASDPVTETPDTVSSNKTPASAENPFEALMEGIASKFDRQEFRMEFYVSVMTVICGGALIVLLG